MSENTATVKLSLGNWAAIIDLLRNAGAREAAEIVAGQVSLEKNEGA